MVAEGALGGVAGIVQLGEGVELVAGLDADPARSGAGVDGQVGGQGDLGAQHLVHRRGRLLVPGEPAVAGTGEQQHPPAANALTATTSAG